MTSKTSKREQREKITDVAPAQADRVLAVLSYLWIFFVVPLVLRPESAFIQFHAKQGIVVALAWFMLWVIGIVPLLGWLLFPVGSLLLLAVNVLAIVKAWQGEMWRIPYLHQYVARLGL
ncbi:MAG: DUF4870 domain-containing protein [Patescibacteria group bacterium]